MKKLRLRDWQSLTQHLVTYPAVKAFLVALAITTFGLMRPWIANLHSFQLFAASFAIAFVGYFFTYSLRSKRYHFYEEGQFNLIYSQNVSVIRSTKNGNLFGYTLEFQVNFFDEMVAAPTFTVPEIEPVQGVTHSNLQVLVTDRKKAIFSLDVTISAQGILHLTPTPDKSIRILNYVADATDSTLPNWFMAIYRKIPGKR